MKTVNLTRVERTDKHTLGIITIDGKWICNTLELPWKDNERNVSCIPVGEYRGVKYISQKFGVTILLDVQDRFGILFHAGNVTEDTEGCIMPFTHFKRDGLEVYTQFSQNKMDDFLIELEDVSEITLVVKDLE